MKRLTYILAAFLLFSGSALFAQQKLVLTKIGNKNKIYFYAGEEVKLQVRGADNFVGGPIKSFEDKKINFQDFSIDLDSISTIDIRDKHMGGFNIGQYGPSLMVAGALFLGADIVNQEELDGQTAAISGAIIGTGLTLWLVRRKNFKVGGKNKIAIID